MAFTDKLTEMQLRDEMEQLETQKQKILLDLSKAQEALKCKDINCSKLLFDLREIKDLNSNYEKEILKCNQTILIKEQEIQNMHSLDSELKCEVVQLINQLSCPIRYSEVHKHKFHSFTDSINCLKNVVHKFKRQLEFKTCESLNLQSQTNLIRVEIVDLKKINKNLLIENNRFKESISKFEKSAILWNMKLYNLTTGNKELKTNLDSYSEKCSLLEKQLLASQEQNASLERHIQSLASKISSLEHDLLSSRCLFQLVEQQLDEASNNYELAKQQRSMLEMSASELRENETRVSSILNELVKAYSDTNIDEFSTLEKCQLLRQIYEDLETKNKELLYQNKKVLVATETVVNQLHRLKVKSAEQETKSKTNSNDCDNSNAKKLTEKCQHLQTRISNLERSLRANEKTKSLFLSSINEELNRSQNLKLFYSKNCPTEELTLAAVKEMFTSLISSFKDALEGKKKLQGDLKMYQKKFEAFAKERELFNKRMFDQVDIH